MGPGLGDDRDGDWAPIPGSYVRYLQMFYGRISTWILHIDDVLKEGIVQPILRVILRFFDSPHVNFELLCQLCALENEEFADGRLSCRDSTGASITKPILDESALRRRSIGALRFSEWLDGVTQRRCFVETLMKQRH